MAAAPERAERHPGRPHGHLSALYRIGEGWETVRRVDGEHERPVDAGAAADANERLSAPVRLRKGWMLGTAPGAARAGRSRP